MHTADTRFYFDFVDPLSWVVDQALSRPTADPVQARVRYVGLELRPPPEPLLDPDGDWWRERRDRALGLAETLGLTAPAEPALIPWTRKAHELLAHARASGVEAEVRHAVFDAFFRQGDDIGRVDVLVKIGGSFGLDATGTKATLDVDRYAADVEEQRAGALAEGIREPPVLVGDLSVVQDFRKDGALRTFLRP